LKFDEIIVATANSIPLLPMLTLLPMLGMLPN
jgi:hypothetical protein